VARAKPVIASRQALRDIDDALFHYIAEAGDAVALRFVDALDKAFGLLSRQPGIGSPRYAHELNLPGLRSWPLSGFPYLLLYMEHDDAVDVARVLHGASDIPATLASPQA
jgi:toxin ParE1/3/4